MGGVVKVLHCIRISHLPKSEFKIHDVHTFDACSLATHSLALAMFDAPPSTRLGKSIACPCCRRHSQQRGPRMGCVCSVPLLHLETRTAYCMNERGVGVNLHASVNQVVAHWRCVPPVRVLLEVVKAPGRACALASFPSCRPKTGRQDAASAAAIEFWHFWNDVAGRACPS